MSYWSRVVAAKYLVQHLKLDWRYGFCHFQSMLIDFDPIQSWYNFLAVSLASSSPSPTVSRTSDATLVSDSLAQSAEATLDAEDAEGAENAKGVEDAEGAEAPPDLDALFDAQAAPDAEGPWITQSCQTIAFAVDDGGYYVRKWCPELGLLPAPEVHAPDALDPEELRMEYEVEIGVNYPAPLVEIN